MATCWAQELGGCGGGFTQEHLVSQALRPGARLLVTGFSWCRDKPKEIPARSLTAHILCKSHNGALSPVDAVAGAAFRALRDALLLVAERRALRNRQWEHRVFAIPEADLLERWFLKTMLNFIVTKPGDLRWRSTDHEAREIPVMLLRLAFGLEKFASPMGLYIGAAVNEQVALSESIIFSPLAYNGPNLVGGLFSFGGWRFILHLEPYPLPDDLLAHIRGSKHTNVGELQYHIKGLNYRIDEAASHQVAFEWYRAPEQLTNVAADAVLGITGYCAHCHHDQAFGGCDP